ncbi:hypothetical protein VTL71DRAFT_5068 [Oculimacula yallundae]|uniref:DUF7580 domain-containing protein n=1 Tax=Oculimacula yallundae TaxID=86028 RepID=A0ABR4C2L7_9HELO
MSGFEVVGVVLGAFPILVGAAKKWMEGVEALVEWRKFRPRFISFIGAIDVENTIFRNTLLNVMRTATDSMSMDVDYLEWKNPILSKALNNPAIAEALENHLGDSYEGFIRTVTTIRSAIEGLHDLLTSADGNADWADPNKPQWERRLKSFQFSFLSEGEQLKNILEDGNKRLERLLASNAQTIIVRASVSSSKCAWVRLFRVVRDQYLSLHDALQNAWICDCRTSHRSWLHLDTTYADTKDPSFGLMFELEVEAGPFQGRRRKMLLQNNVVIRTEQETKRGSHISYSATASSSSLATDVTKLEYDLKAAHLISTQKPKKLQKKLRFAPTLSAPQPPSRHGTASPGTSQIRPNPGENVQRLYNLCNELQLASNVGFCAGYMIGNEGQHHYLTIKTRRELDILIPRTASLEDLLLRRNGLEFRREQRYQVASILASSLLHLHTTPWMPTLGKENIVFPLNGHNVATDSPFLLQSFKKTATHPSTALQVTGPNQIARTASEKAIGALGGLGILLLELYFGETIEQCPLRSKYFRRDGSVGKLTDLQTAREWVKDMFYQEPGLENVILCCIKYSFPQKADWSNTEFRQAVYDNIVEPLVVLADTWR